MAAQRRTAAREDVLKRWTDAVAYHSKTVVAVVGLVLIAILQFPWMKPLLAVGGVDTMTVSLVVLAVVSVATFFEVRALSGARVEEPEQFVADPAAVYPLLLETIKRTKRQDEKTLDVLGLTLFTAWNTIGIWLSGEEDVLAGWTLRLSAIKSGDRRISAIPSDWYREARDKRRAVQSFIAAQPVERRGSLKLYTYDFMPAVHGFKMGNGDIYLSILQWRPDGQIGADKYSFEYIPASSSTDVALLKRNLFNSWLARSQRIEDTDLLKPDEVRASTELP